VSGRRTRATTVAPALALLTLAAALAGCGGGGGGAASTAASGSAARTAATTAPERPDGPSALAADDAKDASGVVTLCGADADVAAAAPAIGRFNVERPRLQASTLGFPAGPGRTLRELRARVAAASKECDVVVVPAADVPALAADGGLVDLQPYAERRGETAALDVVRSGVDVFAVRAAFGPRPRPVLAVTTSTGNPGGALALLDALSGGRAVPPEKP
jgi:ABC-type glycerol-3-phosphate transport system substrate-binding protein